MKHKFSSPRNNMSRILSLILVFVFVVGFASVSATAEENGYDDSGVMTDTLLLIDTDSGEVLYSKNSDLKRPMASTVKILTYIVAVENIVDLENEMIQITYEPISDVSGLGASMAGFENHIGESFSALDVLYGLMLPSGCDAAQVLAYHVGGTPENFAKMLNEKAKELGCEDSYFFEGHGLSDKNYTTAEDLVKITEYALTLPYFSEMVKSEYYTVDGYSYPLINTNYLIDVENGSKYYYRYATGVKTGYTSASGRCLVSTAKKGDDEYMCIALGGTYSADDGYINHAMTDSVDLYEWAFSQFTENIGIEIDKSYASLSTGETIGIKARITENTTGEVPAIKWSSSDEDIATVDQNGNVFAKALGQVTITAATQTGNFDTVAVSCGFYNGIDVTSRYGDYSSGSKKPIDWKAVKENGFDFSVIRAGWGSEDYPNQNDAEFVNNVKGAHENDIPYLLSFIAYAQSPTEAQAEADYFLREMDEYFPSECADGLVAVVYNMTYSPYSSNDKKLNTDIALAFGKELRDNGLRTIIFANKSVETRLDTEKLTQNNVNTYYSYYPYSADFSNYITTVDGFVPLMWQYRSDGYFPQASENLSTKQSIMYMMSHIANSTPEIEPTTTLKDNYEVTLKWDRNDMLTDSYTVCEILDSGERVEIAQLKGTADEYTIPQVGIGSHCYLVEKNMTDIMTQEIFTLVSKISLIDIYHHYDVNNDGDYNIFDVSYIQQVLAELLVPCDTFSVYGDVNNDGEINIIDASHIQLVLAGFTE